MVYLISPSIASVDKLIKNHIAKIGNNVSNSQNLFMHAFIYLLKDQRSHHVLFVPESTYVLLEQLKADPKIWAKIESIAALPFHWFPTSQTNYLHMGLPQLPFKMLVDGDWNYLYKCALGLYQLESRMNKIPVIQYKGSWSVRVVDILKKLRSQVNKHNMFILILFCRKKRSQIRILAIALILTR